MPRYITDSYLYRAIGADIDGACGKCTKSRSDCMCHSLSRMDICGIIDDAPTVNTVEIKKDGEWEMFGLISSAYYGKGMYFKQDDGTVYSRYSCKYMSVDEAIREFVSLIDDSDLPPVADVPDRKVGEWEKKWHSFFKQELLCCSICHKFTPMRTPYCALCGARMNGERREDDRKA